MLSKKERKKERKKETNKERNKEVKKENLAPINLQLKLTTCWFEGIWSYSKVAKQESFRQGT